MSDVIIHSIHCRGYRGGAVGFDDSDCDCGATIKALTARLAATEAESWRVVVPTPTADDPTRMLEMEVIAVDHKEHVITVSAYVHEAAKGGRDERATDM